jgi:CubicO group peptidase (beta-lactamase class C family)
MDHRQTIRSSAVEELAESLFRLAEETTFSGVVRIDQGGETLLAEAYGWARRDLGIPNTVDTMFAIASGSKSFTALAILSLVEEGRLALDTTARSLLGDDLSLIADDVTVEHLLSHRSGIGDYLDEETSGPVTDYLMTVPVHQLADTEDFLRVLDGYPTRAPAGERFEYCNGGYVVLAVLAERASGIPFHELVVERVCRPAGMVDTSYLRSDELPARTAFGYLFADGLRTNVLHLPVRGSGDGGAWSTLADVHALWAALDGGSIVRPATWAEMVRPRGATESGAYRYGLGFWLSGTGGIIEMEGHDAGVSFRSTRDPDADTTVTVMSNTSEGAWPIAEHLATRLGHPA